MKAKWSRTTPDIEGWYWMKYRGKHGITKCPAFVCRLQRGVHVRTARNDSFFAGPDHGGWKLKDANGKEDKAIRFGPMIEEPAG